MQSFRSRVCFLLFPLSCPYPAFCPLKASHPLLGMPAVTDAILISGERHSLSLFSKKDNTDSLNIFTYSFQTGDGSPSRSNPVVPPFLACIIILPTPSRVGGTACFIL